MALVYYPPLNHPVVDRHGNVTTVWRNYFQTVSSSITPGGGPGITQLTGPVTTPAGGGVQPTTITPTGVTPGTYGDDEHVGQFTVNAAGQITAATDVLITASGGAPSPADAHYEPVTNGDPVNPDLIYNVDGDVVMGWVT